MLIKEITYTDYNGNKRTEKFYFNISKAEIIKMDLQTPGGMKEKIETIINRQDIPKVAEMFEEIIMLSYGEKSDDGKYFKKSRELSETFTHTEAYSNLLVELISNPDKAAEFVREVISVK